MKLRNKKTGDIAEVLTDTIAVNVLIDRQDITGYYGSLAELNEEWEDYEEPKEYWCITGRGNLHHLQDITDENDKDHREIGNYFETKEEAEKAVEKLKAWKRLRDKGFKFDGYSPDFEGFWVIYPNDTEGTWCLAEDKADLDFLFGGEE